MALAVFINDAMRGGLEALTRAGNTAQKGEQSMVTLALDVGAVSRLVHKPDNKNLMRVAPTRRGVTGAVR
jgi:hypothetical protein